MHWAWIPGILLRLLIPLTIRRYPLWGAVLAMLADTLDVVIWDISGVPNIGQHYTLFDKLLDSYMYLIMGSVVWGWENKKARAVGLGLLGYRFLGVILFSVTHVRALMLVFPDIFIFFYFYYLLLLQIKGKDVLTNYRRLSLAVGVLAIPKLYQEYLFHVVEFPVYQFFQPVVRPVLDLF